MTQHDFGCRHDGPHSDAAKRLADTYNLHYDAGALYGATNVGKWIAVKLEDGRSDNQIYPSRSDAVWHQNNDEIHFAFAQIIPQSMSVCAAEAFLRMRRLEYDRHMNLNDRAYKDGGFDIIPRLNNEDQLLQEYLINNGAGHIAIGRAE